VGGPAALDGSDGIESSSSTRESWTFAAEGRTANGGMPFRSTKA
jgi:hypothetical protein